MTLYNMPRRYINKLDKTTQSRYIVAIFICTCFQEYVYTYMCVCVCVCACVIMCRSIGIGMVCMFVCTLYFFKLSVDGSRSCQYDHSHNERSRDSKVDDEGRPADWGVLGRL